MIKRDSATPIESWPSSARSVTAAAIISDWWIHIMERFDRAIQDARRGLQAMPIPARVRVQVAAGRPAESDVESEAVRVSRAERKGPR
jgi:hypothetical protein